MTIRGQAVVDRMRFDLANPPSIGVMRAAFKWSETAARKDLSKLPLNRNIGGYMFHLYIKEFVTGRDGMVLVEAICTKEP